MKTTVARGEGTVARGETDQALQSHGMRPSPSNAGLSAGGHSPSGCDTYSLPWEGAGESLKRRTLSLTVTETDSLHDGEPMHWWEWTEAAQDFGQIPRFFSARFGGDSDRHALLAGQTERAYRQTSPIVAPINLAHE